MTPSDLSLLEATVHTAAREELLPRFRNTRRHEKADGSWLTEADLVMQSRLQAELSTRHPTIALLGKEMEATEQQRLLEQAGGHADTLDGQPAPLNLVARSAICATDRVLFEQWRNYLRSTT